MSGIRIIGARELADEIRDSGGAYRRALVMNTKKAGEAVVRQAQAEGFKGSRTRSLYEIRGGKRVARKPPRQVTAPADKLGVFEGTYRRAISYEYRERWPMGPYVEVGPSNVRYAPIHEYGGAFRAFGKYPGVMPKRPVMGPAVDATQEQVFQLIGASFKVVRG